MSERLILVVGASGVGKDSLLNQVRHQLRHDARVRFATRLITRPAQAGGEQHRSISQQRLARLWCAGALALHWQANGLWYGIGTEIDAWLAAGSVVVVNASRAALASCRQHYPDARLIWITAEQAIIAERLRARGREHEDAIRQRLQRGRQLEAQRPADAIVIDNSGPLEQAARHFQEALCHCLELPCHV